ncbi:MAG: hypothetical protein B7Z52_07830 [Burkholderiales bacterium 12-64-5]|nr:MAG: hypothetical protein B7Z52_07830 [Burkholderiales bacterium 12-64-5]
MAQAIRLMTVERGHDPRGFDYLCFGGAGPVHALDLARSLEMARVLVPPVPGLFSALGMVLADRQADLQAAVDRPLSACDGTELEARYAEMEGAARGRLPADAAQSIRRRADCRYAGQPDSIMVDVVDCAPVAIRAAFEAAHRHLWNFTKPDQPVLLNNIRVEARAATGWRGALRFAKGDPAPAPSRTRTSRGSRRGACSPSPWRWNRGPHPGSRRRWHDGYRHLRDPALQPVRHGAGDEAGDDAHRRQPHRAFRRRCLCRSVRCGDAACRAGQRHPDHAGLRRHLHPRLSRGDRARPAAARRCDRQQRRLSRRRQPPAGRPVHAAGLPGWRDHRLRDDPRPLERHRRPIARQLHDADLGCLRRGHPHPARAAVPR